MPLHLLLGKMNNQINIMRRVHALPPPFNEGLEELSRAEVVFLRGEAEPEPLFARAEALRLTPVSGQGRAARIAAVDSSCRRIGETLSGTIYATRVSCVVSSGKRVLSHLRLGPFLSYLTEAMLAKLASSDPLQALLMAEPGLAERFLRSAAERWLQARIAEEGGVDYLLLDGPLCRTPLELPPNDFGTVLGAARRSGITLLGLSKTSRLRALMRALSCLGLSGEAPAYIRIREADEDGIAVYAVRLSRGGDAFRLDLDESLCDIRAALLDLRHNEALSGGYPESLKLAHHLSVIRDVDVASVASYIMARFKAHQVAFMSRRRLLLPGPPLRA
jgi:hypothetical protein